MERNMHFEIAGLNDIVVRLAWAQLEIFADDVEKIQVMAAGDEATVSDLRIGIRESELLIEQPQYGLSLNLTESRWLQVCVRVPRTWEKAMHISTISGSLSARGLQGREIVLDTVSGDVRAVRVHAEKLSLKTISGDMRAEKPDAKAVSVRSVSGDVAMDEMNAETLKCNSVSGRQRYHLVKGFERIDINAVSGDVVITSTVTRMNVVMRSISGQVRTEGVSVTEEAGVPMVRATGISADLKLISIQ